MEEIKFLAEKEASRVSKFLDDMLLPTIFSWQSSKKPDFWVFWSAEKASNHTSTYLDHGFSIQDRIKTALSADDSYYPNDVLIQFWAASMTEDGRRLLTTSDQPFAINYLPDEKLIQYKKDCSKYKFVGDHYLTDDGPVSRVFRTQLLELSPNLSYYSVKEYPERDLALGCGFEATFVLPVLEPNLQCCVGVLELLFTKHINSAIIMLKAAGLVRLDTVNPMQLCDHILQVHLVLVKEELNRAMTQVRQTHGLPLVCFWARCEHNTDACDVKCSTGEFPVISIPRMAGFDHNNYSFFDFVYYYNFLLIREGQGHIGKAFHADKPCFCGDVTRLSIIDYPLAHVARLLEFRGGFAVCLQSIATGIRAYVLEFFLPQDKSHSGDLHNFLSSILTTLRQHLKTFKVVTGDIGNDLFTEISYLNESNVEANNTSFTSFHTISLLSTSSGHKTTSSSRSIESTMNSKQRKLNNYTGPSGNRSYLDPSPSNINEPVDSETGSSGRVMISASQYQVPTMKVSRGDSSLSNAPCSEGSAIVARNIPPSTMVDVEMATVNENYDEEL